jgi:predicted PurR-regulated permease PerM
MNNVESSSVDQKFVSNSMAAFVQIAAMVILLYWCFTIISPFLGIFIWGLILSVALYPSHVALSARLGGREKLSATLIVLCGIFIISLPILLLADSTIGALNSVAAELEDGTAQIPPPADKVADWPLIGEKVHAVWSTAATNLEETINQFRPQLETVGKKVVTFAAHAAGSAVMFILSIIAAGVMFTSASGGRTAAQRIASKLAGASRGPAITDLSILTIRSVAKGIMGIAFIQAILSAIGLLVAGVPGAGLWAGIVLVLAIVQLPPFLLLGPIAVWYFSVAELAPAVIFLVYAIIVSASDAVLKPLLLGRGVDTPMLVILVGAIGGALAQGIIGLFIGAVTLALGYEILKAWMESAEAQRERADT